MALAGVLALAGCGCASDRAAERGRATESADAGQHETWGVRFAMAPAWTGGENDAGGYELTNGQLALLVGRHQLEPGDSLEGFLESRKRALAEQGLAADAAQSEQRIDGERVLLLAGRAGAEEGSVEVRLAVVRRRATEGVSLLMIGPAGHQDVDREWSALLGALDLR